MFIIGLIIAGLIIGALGRLVHPGPDPMPIWLTMVIGIAASLDRRAADRRCARLHPRGRDRGDPRRARRQLAPRPHADSDPGQPLVDRERLRAARERPRRPSAPSRRRARCSCRARACARRRCRRRSLCASPRRRGRGCPRPGAIEMTTLRLSPGSTSNSCRSADVPWWMWPPRISSAPDSTSAESTWFRCATGFFRVRHGAPIIWWWSATTRSAPGAPVAEPRRHPVELRVADAARLMPPGADGVEADDLGVRVGVHRLDRLPLALELAATAS